jgi:hypothetical protein
MNGTRLARLLAIGLVVGGWLAATADAAPWDKVLTLRRVEADPDKSYRLTKKQGPWTIMACSFSGPKAEEEARQLVLELRKRYKLEAYTYRKTFELGDEVYGRGVNRFGEAPKMRYQRGPEIDEVAVMVGNYPSIDDPEAQETLNKLKYYRPASLEVDTENPTARNLASWRLFWKHVSPEKQKKGPMGSAMLTRNPLLPKEFFVPAGLDPLVVKANEGVDHCLLDCPGKYTVQVATFRGRVINDADEIAAIESGRKKIRSELAEAAEKAHKLTEALRQKGYQAYEFHDRYASIVTVGSFDWVSRQLPDGRGELNPAIQSTMSRFGPKQTPFGGQTQGMAQQMLVGIPFDPAPRIVEVPQRSISTALRRETASLF